MMQQHDAVEPISISEYVSMLAKRKLLVVLCLALGLSAAVLTILTASPKYEATAKLTVKPPASPSAKTASLTDSNGAVESLFFQELTLNTHLELIRSRPVLERLIDKLRLDQQAAEEQGGLRQFIKQIKTNLHLLLIGDEKVLNSAEKKYLLAESIKKQVTLENTELTNLLTVTVEDSDPELASAIANALAEIYIQYDIGNNQLASSNSFTFLTNQAAEFKVKLDKAEADFLTYKQQENMFSLETTHAGIEEKKRAYDALLIETQNKLQQIELRLNELESLAGDKKNYAVRLRTLLGNPVIDNLNSQLIAAEIEQSKLSKIYRSKHAEMQAIQGTINDLRMELGRQIEKEISNMKKEREILHASVERTQHSIEELKKEAMDVSGKGKQYLILEDNVKTYKKYYETLISKIEDVSVSSEIKNAVTSINLVERAETPIYPVKPKKLQIILAGLFGGLFSGIGLVLLLEFSDRTLHTEEDVRACLGLPVVGFIPIASQKIVLRNTLIAADGRKA